MSHLLALAAAGLQRTSQHPPASVHMQTAQWGQACDVDPVTLFADRLVTAPRHDQRQRVGAVVGERMLQSSIAGPVNGDRWRGGGRGGEEGGGRGMLQCCQWRSVAGRVEAAGRCRGAQPAVINHSFRTATTQPPHPTQRVVHHASRTDRSAGQKDAALLLQLGFPVTAGRHAVRVQAGTDAV